ncbi:hypothetical protein HY449_04115 [Candidatus Pacearchaeota archaeon]|nr:hypothetical protein [Candidatus Pacearchaeota archaeon]
MENEISQKGLEDISKQVACLDRHRDNPLVQDVIRGKILFKEKVLDFYGVWPDAGKEHCGLFTTSRSFVPAFSKKKEPEKMRKCPEGLIEVLDDFAEKSFDRTSLVYEKVREEYERGHNLMRNYTPLYGTIGMLAVSAGITLTFMTEPMIFSKYPPESLSDGLIKFGIGFIPFFAGVGGIFYARKLTGDEMERNAMKFEDLQTKPNQIRSEFTRLYKMAENVDNGARHYRKNAIEHALE